MQETYNCPVCKCPQFISEEQNEHDPIQCTKCRAFLRIEIENFHEEGYKKVLKHDSADDQFIYDWIPDGR